MDKIQGKIYDEERALYNIDSIIVENCRFDGPQDGESALKESKNIVVNNSFFNLRYPFWHDNNIEINNCELTENCRAALWYSQNIKVNKSILNGIKAFRECSIIEIKDTKMVSPEGFWNCSDIKIDNSDIDSMYFLMRSSDIIINNTEFKGKYSFQYVNNLIIKDSNLDTKDAFWHSNNVVEENSIIKGEYLGWYSNGLTLKNCTIIGTQPLCYAKNLKIINCKFEKADLAFEYSEVEADIIGEVISVKNPISGYINADKIGEVILENSKYDCNCKITSKH